MKSNKFVQHRNLSPNWRLWEKGDKFEMGTFNIALTLNRFIHSKMNIS